MSMDQDEQTLFRVKTTFKNRAWVEAEGREESKVEDDKVYLLWLLVVMSTVSE